MINEYIKGIPKPQPRPRAFARGGRAGIYNPKTANKWKNQIVEGLKKYSKTDSTSPIYLILTFYMPRPKSHYGTGKNSKLMKKQAPKEHTRTPDIDNLAKAVMDAITHINIWRDDSQVITISANKMWSNKPEDSGAQITIKESGK